MKYLFFTIILVFVKLTIAQNCNTVTEESLTITGPYSVELLIESDGLRDGPDYSGATIYYPIGLTSPLANIVIVPGFFGTQSDVEEWGPYLASHGIITMIIGTNNLWDQPADRANALIDGMETLKQENIRAGSPLIGIIDTNKFAVAGWSMGGGGAQLAAVLDSSIIAVMAFCPWLDTTSPPILNHSAPVLIFSGENDPTAPPADHANVHYSTTPNQTDKVIYEISGGVHDVANSPTGANGEVGKLGLAWLQRYLIGNYCYCPVILDDLLNQPAVTSDYSYNINCDLLSIENKVSNKLLNIYPNPSNSMINVETTFEVSQDYYIMNLTGTIVKNGTLTQNIEQIDISNFTNGIYFIMIKSQAYKLIKM